MSKKIRIKLIVIVLFILLSLSIYSLVKSIQWFKDLYKAINTEPIIIAAEGNMDYGD